MFKYLKEGTRVEVTLNNGDTITGTVVEQIKTGIEIDAKDTATYVIPWTSILHLAYIWDEEES